MTEIFLPGLPDFPIVLRRSARARRISLRVSRLDGRVTLTLPKSVPESEAISFDFSFWTKSTVLFILCRIENIMGSLVLS